jgi:signal transduction histidine kinase
VRAITWDVAADPGARLYFGVARDLAEEEVRRQERFQADFINLAAHELNTPLTPIQLALDTLTMRLDPVMGREVRQGAELVQRNFQRLRELVAELLDAARIRAGRLPLELEEADLAALAREALAEKAGLIEAEGITVHSELETGLPCVVDVARMRQVLGNLFLAAIACADGSGQMRVRALRAGGEAVLGVECAKAAISRRERERLFLLFPVARDPVPSGRLGGGVGLYMARGIVELHGGRVSAREAGPDGEGLGLELSLPVSGPARQSKTLAAAAAMERAGTAAQAASARSGPDPEVPG